MEEDVHLLFCPIFLDVYVCVLVFDAVIIRLGRCQTHNLDATSTQAQLNLT